MIPVQLIWNRTKTTLRLSFLQNSYSKQNYSAKTNKKLLHALLEKENLKIDIQNLHKIVIKLIKISTELNAIIKTIKLETFNYQIFKNCLVSLLKRIFFKWESHPHTPIETIDVIIVLRNKKMRKFSSYFRFK